MTSETDDVGNLAQLAHLAALPVRPLTNREGLIRVSTRGGRIRRLSALAGAVCVALVLVATGSSFAGASQKHVSRSAGVKHAKAEIAKYEKVPKFTPPSGGAFNISGAAGKTIESIPVSSTILFERVMESAAQTVAAKYGVHWVSCTNQGSPTQWIECMDQAVAKHVSVITLFGGINPADLKPEIAAARNAGIHVVVGHYFSTATKTPSYLTGQVPQNFNEFGRMLADWAIAQTKGKGHIIFIDSTTLGKPSTTALAGIKHELSKYGPTMTMDFIDVPITSWAKTITPDVQAALARNPSVHWVLPIYDSMSTYAIAAIKAEHDTGKVFVATSNGDPPFMKDVADHSYIKEILGENPYQQAYAQLDLNMRLMTGHKAVTEHVVQRLFDSKDIKTAGTPPQEGVGYGTAFKKGYAKLWKK